MFLGKIFSSFWILLQLWKVKSKVSGYLIQLTFRQVRKLAWRFIDEEQLMVYPISHFLQGELQR